MLWRQMLKGTAVGLLTAGAQSAGATVQSSKDTTAPADALPWLAVYADDKKHGISGAEPRFHTVGTVTIELRAGGTTQGAAEAQLDALCDLVENTLLGTQGQDVACTCTAGSAVIAPASLAGLAVGMKIMGAGIPQTSDVAILAIDPVASLVTLTQAWNPPPGTTPAPNYSVSLNIGSFVALFEAIESVDTYSQYDGKENRNHLASATIEIAGHTSERFEPSFTTCLDGVNLYVEAIEIGELPTS